jgi:hypothetical protein
VPTERLSALFGIPAVRWFGSVSCRCRL